MLSLLDLNGFQRLGQTKPIQRGVITIAAGSNTGTATLTPTVDSRRAVVRFGGFTGDSGLIYTSAWNQTQVHLRLSDDGTTVTALRGGIGVTNAMSVPWEVEEHYPGVLQAPVQRGLKTGVTGTTATQAIRAVNTSRTQLVWGGFRDTSSFTLDAVNQASWFVDETLTDETTITFAKTGASGNYEIPWQTVER